MCGKRALCYSSKINRSDPGRIVFIKQTSEAQDGATPNLRREIINTLAAHQSQNGRQVLEGTKRIAGKNDTARILRDGKLEQHKNNYLA